MEFIVITEKHTNSTEMNGRNTSEFRVFIAVTLNPFSRILHYKLNYFFSFPNA